jgi:ribosomal protein S12 methylthiotransferase
MKLQSGISMRKHRALVGCTLPVLIEGESPETELLLTGRSSTMAPEVDGRILINKGTGIVGGVMPVLIREAHPYDMIGEIVE